MGVGDDLGHTVSGEGLADIAFGDVFLEPGEDALEGLGGVAEERGVGDAAGVEGAEDDAGGRVEAGVELAAHHHEGEFAVFIGFAGLEGLGVDHGDGGLEAGFEALHVAQVGGGGDGDFAAEFFGIGGDGAERH